jgi:hypothetical protein
MCNMISIMIAELDSRTPSQAHISPYSLETRHRGSCPHAVSIIYTGRKPAILHGLTLGRVQPRSSRV